MASLIHRKAWFSWTGKAKEAMPSVVGLVEADGIARIGQTQNVGTRTPGAGAQLNGRITSQSVAANTMNYPDTVNVNYGVSTGYSCAFTDAGDLVGLPTIHPEIEEGKPVYFTTVTTTTGINNTAQYYAKNVGATSMQVSATRFGAALALTTNGTGVLMVGAR
jgi:hypothetical protein